MRSDLGTKDDIKSPSYGPVKWTVRLWASADRGSAGWQQDLTDGQNHLYTLVQAKRHGPAGTPPQQHQASQLALQILGMLKMAIGIVRGNAPATIDLR